MQWPFHRRKSLPFSGTVKVGVTHLLSGKSAFVNASGRDPEPALSIHHGDISTRGSCVVVFVHSIKTLYNLRHQSVLFFYKKKKKKTGKLDGKPDLEGGKRDLVRTFLRETVRLTFRRLQVVEEQLQACVNVQKSTQPGYTTLHLVEIQQASHLVLKHQNILCFPIFFG